MGKDADFKNEVSIEGYAPVDFKTVDADNMYHPDAVFEKGGHLVILESSSTNDRKPHIGELMQFLSFVSKDDKYKEYSFALFLCGKGKGRPKVSTEIKRLQHYYDSFPISKAVRDKIKEIAVAEQEGMDLKIETIEGFSRLEL